MRQTALVFLVAGVALAGASAIWSCEKAARWRTNRERLFAITVECQPILSAIHASRVDHHAYPKQLSALVPTRLARMPTPPTPSDRDWEYVIGQGIDGFELAVYLPGEFYPYGWQFWTVLVYRSDRQYPEYDYGGVLAERIGEWAFYVE